MGCFGALLYLLQAERQRVEGLKGVGGLGFGLRSAFGGRERRQFLLIDALLNVFTQLTYAYFLNPKPPKTLNPPCGLHLFPATQFHLTRHPLVFMLMNRGKLSGLVPWEP